MGRTIAIDFDGVVHKYSNGWADGTAYDVAVEGAFSAIETLMNQGYRVFIFSTRAADQIIEWFENRKAEWKIPPLIEEIPDDVMYWTKVGVLGVTKRKLPALLYIDDRALIFNGNWDYTLSQVSMFETYQESSGSADILDSILDPEEVLVAKVRDLSQSLFDALAECDQRNIYVWLEIENGHVDKPSPSIKMKMTKNLIG